MIEGANNDNQKNPNKRKLQEKNINNDYQSKKQKLSSITETDSNSPILWNIPTVLKNIIQFLNPFKQYEEQENNDMTINTEYQKTEAIIENDIEDQISEIIIENKTDEEINEAQNLKTVFELDMEVESAKKTCQMYDSNIFSEIEFSQKENEKKLTVFEASSEGNLIAIEKLIKEGVDVNEIEYVNGELLTPLIIAARNNHVDVVRAIINANSSKVEYKPLDWKDRPDEVKERILEEWTTLQVDTTSNWGIYNGRSNYSVMFKEHDLVKAIIKENPTRKEFFVLDIGAGNFQFGIALAKYLNNATDIPKDIKVNIISIRGEINLDEAKKVDSICNLINLGSFKVENLCEEFAAQGFDLENKLDLIVSSWCFLHLVDPVGTFLQAYNLLRPKTGFMFMTGDFAYQRGATQYIYGNQALLLLYTKAPFLLVLRACPHTWESEFILRRSDEAQCQLPLSYKALTRSNKQRGWNTGCEWVTEFNDLMKYSIPLKAASYPLYELAGNKDLYDYFLENELFYTYDFDNINYKYKGSIEIDQYEKAFITAAENGYVKVMQELLASCPSLTDIAKNEASKIAFEKDCKEKVEAFEKHFNPLTYNEVEDKKAETVIKEVYAPMFKFNAKASNDLENEMDVETNKQQVKMNKKRSQA